MKFTQRTVSIHRTAKLKYFCLIGYICIASLVFKGCVPENISLPGQLPDSPSDTLATPSDTVSTPSVTVPEAFTNYFEQGITLNCTADEVEMVFKVDTDWMMEVVDDDGKDVTWCSLSTDLGSAGLHKVKVRTEDNAGYDVRTARILLLTLDNTKLAEAVVTQDSKKAILLSQKDTTVSHKATTVEVLLKSNVDFEYEILDADWVREKPQASRGLSTHKLTFEIGANTSHKARETKIIFCSTQYAVADTLTIAQEGVVPTVSIPEGYTDYFTDGLSFSPMAGEAEVTFQVNVDWQLATVGASSWLSVESSSGTAGQQTVTVRVTGNNTKTDRAATISLMCDDIKLAEIVVTQEQMIFPEGDEIFNELPSKGTTVEVNFDTNINVEYKIMDADWVHEQSSPTHNMADYHIVFDVDANPSQESRSAEIVFYNSHLAVSYTVTLIQEGVVTIVTGEATNVTANEATLNGTLNGSRKFFSCGVIYGTTPELAVADEMNQKWITTSPGDFSVNITGLKANTTYYYRAVVRVGSSEYEYGEILSFQTELADAIDLGLSVKWASFNVGAKAPEEYGGYYAWGETEEKEFYQWSTYKWYNSSNSTLTKYGYHHEPDTIGVTVDNKTTLDPEDDVAHVLWGDGWRMPTKDEMEELREKCSWEWTSVNGVSGAKVTGPNGNSIFLPAAGWYGEKSTEVRGRGDSGFYWSTTLSEYGSSYAYNLFIDNGFFEWDIAPRYFGQSVRPVKE